MLEVKSKKEIKKRISFEDWCINNLSKERSDEILSRWDYDLNIDKNGKHISPKDITFSSSGAGNKNGYWFKCLKNPKHESERKSVSSFTNGRERSINCSKCICEYDKVPYPEKFVFKLLEQLDIDAKIQLSKLSKSWCGLNRYDFYLKDYNCIIETHGLQHYEETNRYWNMSLKEVQNNDKYKEDKARKNGIDNYIIIDCRYSELNWMKKSIVNNKELVKLLNINIDNINWLECHEFACSNMIKIACDLWNSGMKDLVEIANKLNINRKSISSYLKKGVELGWCNYNPINEINKYFNNKKVKCLTTGEVFNSMAEGAKRFNISVSMISRFFKNNQKSAGRHPETNEGLTWALL